MTKRFSGKNSVDVTALLTILQVKFNALLYSLNFSKCIAYAVFSK